MAFRAGSSFLKEKLKQIKLIMLVTARERGSDRSMDCPCWVARKSHSTLASRLTEQRGGCEGGIEPSLHPHLDQFHLNLRQRADVQQMAVVAKKMWNGGTQNPPLPQPSAGSFSPGPARHSLIFSNFRLPSLNRAKAFSTSFRCSCQWAPWSAKAMPFWLSDRMSRVAFGKQERT